MEMGVCQKAAADTGHFGLHWHEMERIFQGGAVAEVEAYYDYDAHNCLTLFRMSPVTGQSS